MRLPTITLFSALILLGGCPANQGAQNQPASGAAAQAQPQIVYTAKPGLSPKERKLEAINLLQVGDAGRAKAELLAYLAAVPQSKLAQNLLQQIDADPVAYLGAENFSYKMKPGDSLSGIAKRILGDPMKFHILARYNGIDNPSKIEAGQVIKVPGKKTAEKELETVEAINPSELPEVNDDELLAAKAVPEPAPQFEKVSDTAFGSQDDAAKATAQVASVEPAADLPVDVAGTVEAEVPVFDAAPAAENTPADQVAALPPAVEAPQPDYLASPGDVLNQAEALAQDGNYEGAIELYEQGMTIYPDDPLLRKFAAANYETYAGQLELKGRRDKAEDLLYRAQSLDPQSGTIKERLIAYARQDEADEWYHAGTSHLAADKRIEAYEAFRKAVDIVPDHKLANQKLIDLAPAVTEDYHRKALTAFRRQELDPAIGLWDKALLIDSNYAPALLYREQAIDLKKKLEGIRD